MLIVNELYCGDVIESLKALGPFVMRCCKVLERSIGQWDAVMVPLALETT